MGVFKGRAEVKGVVAGMALEFIAEVERTLRDEVVEFPDGAIVGEGHLRCELFGEMLKEVCVRTTDEPLDTADALAMFNELPKFRGEVAGKFALRLARLPVVPIRTQERFRRRRRFCRMEFSISGMSVENF